MRTGCALPWARGDRRDRRPRFHVLDQQQEEIPQRGVPAVQQALQDLTQVLFHPSFMEGDPGQVIRDDVVKDGADVQSQGMLKADSARLLCLEPVVFVLSLPIQPAMSSVPFPGILPGTVLGFCDPLEMV